MARRDRNAALAGLAALGALMYARKRREKGEEKDVEEVKPVRTTTAPKDEGFKTLEDAPQSEKGPMAPAPAASRSLAPKPATPAAPAAPTGAGAGRGMMAGPTAAQLAQAAMGAGGGRGGVGGPKIGEREAYQAAMRPTAGDIRKADIAAEQKQLAERQKRLGTPGSDAVEQDIDVLSPIPGLGRAQRGAQAASRALTTKAPGFSELTFLGKSQPKNITPPRQIGATEKPLLEGPKSAERVGMKSPPKELPPGMTAQDRMREMKMGRYRDDFDMPLKKGGKAKVKKMASGGMARSSSASSRGDGIAKRGKTRGKMY
jgi:hypothetical protein